VRVIARIEDPAVIGVILAHLERTGLGTAGPGCARRGVRGEQPVGRGGEIHGALSLAGPGVRRPAALQWPGRPWGGLPATALKD